MKDEGGRMNEDRENGRASEFILYPSSFILALLPSHA